MNPNVGKILNTLYQKASSSSANTQAAGPCQGVSLTAAARPSPTVLPNPITYSSQHAGVMRGCGHRFDLLPCRPCIGQDEYLERVCNILQDRKVRKVGIFGMGGVGKTTLLERIHNEYLAFSDFDLVIWIPLNKEVDYQNVWKLIYDRERVRTWFYFPLLRSNYFHQDEFQNKFLNRIVGLPNQRNAIQLYNFLSTKKFALLMDNMWEYVDLEGLGIPDPTEENMCKIVFTTRSEEVCRPMNPDAEIKVECLGRNDSRALFEKNVGEKALNSDPWVHGIAQQIVEECGGLPLALITVGRAMSSRCSRERWDSALTLLQSYPYEFQGMEKKLYHSLKFSYDALENETVKQCFLYCSLFPEGYHIGREKLVEYWMGEGYLGHSENLKNLKNRGSEIIGKLESVCLLESVGGMKMHDVVRDMALWIVSRYGKEKHRFFVHQVSRGLGRFTIGEKWSKAYKIFVMDLVDLPYQPACSILSTLLFGENMSQFKFVKAIGRQRVKDEDLNLSKSSPPMEYLFEDLFENMPSLRVLDLSFLPIPQIASRLVALRYLSGSPIGVSKINVGSLITLWFFHLSGSFQEQNFCIIGLGQLTGLRLLNLECGKLKTLPLEVGRLTNLESLVLCKSIHKLPSSIGQLIELRELHAQYSRLESLPEEIGRLTKLEIFILRGRLTKLQKLDLTRASISALPSTIGMAC